MKKDIACMLAQCAIVSVSTLTAIGAGWDNAFHTSFMDSIGNYFEYESVACVTTLGTEVYIGSQDPVYHSGRVWRYKESDGTWQELASVSGSGVYALSAVQDYAGLKYLFVGGSFDNVYYGAQSSPAHNVVALSLTSGTISKLGSDTVYGTDGPVYALKALPWWDFDGLESLYPGVRVLVGGMFTTAGSVNSKSIAMWQQGTFVASQWIGFSGGLGDDGAGSLPKVYGVEAQTKLGHDGETRFNGIWMTGALRRNIRPNIAIHIAKLAASDGSAWTYLGQAFQQVSLDEASCTYSVSIYPSFFGKAICQAGTTVYFGGFSRGHIRSDGNVLVCTYSDPGSTCGFYLGNSGLISVGTWSTSVAVDCALGQVNALASKGTDVYASGLLWQTDLGQTVWFARRSTGSWAALPPPADHNGSVTSAASTTNYVYFAGPYCWRYDPNP